MKTSACVLSFILLSYPALAEDCAALKDKVARAIETANECQIDADCDYIDVGCPWRNTRSDIILGSKKNLSSIKALARQYAECKHEFTQDEYACRNARMTDDSPPVMPNQLICKDSKCEWDNADITPPPPPPLRRGG